MVRLLLLSALNAVMFCFCLDFVVCQTMTVWIESITAWIESGIPATSTITINTQERKDPNFYPSSSSPVYFNSTSTGRTTYGFLLLVRTSLQPIQYISELTLSSSHPAQAL